MQDVMFAVSMLRLIQGAIWECRFMISRQSTGLKNKFVAMAEVVDAA